MKEWNTWYHPQAIILTHNQQLARHLHYHFHKELEAPVAIETPQILTVDTWLKVLWNQSRSEEVILSHFQEHRLWMKISKSSQYIASLMQQAWRLLHHRKIDFESVKKMGAGSLEVETFLHCSEQFVKLCQQNQWISEAELAKRMSETIDKFKNLIQAREIFVAELEELAPIYSDFLKQIKYWIPVGPLPLETNKPSHLQAQISNDSQNEILNAACWAKNFLEHYPYAQVGFIVNRLQEKNTHIKKCFYEIFEGEDFYNTANGTALSEFELISVAIKVLTLEIDHIPYEMLGHLLQSPYLCQNDQDFYLGALIDAECRQAENIAPTLSLVFQAIQKWQNNYPEQTWLNRFRCFNAIKFPQDKQLPSQWARSFIVQLNALGWPGKRTLTTEEYQIICRWRDLIEKLTELDTIKGLINKAEALDCLHYLIDHTFFQSQNGIAKPIQILDIRECKGHHFDAVWIIGLDEASWPNSPKSNPFVPFTLQEKFQIPHCSANNELTYAQKMTEYLLTISPKIWLSCSNRLADHQPANFSKLIPMALRKDLFHGLDELSNKAKNIFDSRIQEQILDEVGLPITRPFVSGGSSILMKQAQCPFQAFAFYRLNAAPLIEPELGVSHKMHGILVHQILDLLWLKIKDHSILLQMEPEDLNRLIEETVNQTLNEKFNNAENVFVQVEKNRLQQLMMDWFKLEKQRPPFKVLEQEAKKILNLAGLNFNITIDRIDLLDNGQQLLIDYKTGSCDMSGWMGERPQQPQLPSYSLALEQSQNALSGIAFAQIKSGECKFKGLHEEGQNDDHFPSDVVSIAKYKKNGSPDTWTELTMTWGQRLKKLAGDFKKGLATVDPSENGKPCRNCHLHSLCRVHNNLLEENPDEDL